MPFIVTDRTILFVHIPKCAGSSVEAWLARHAPLNMWNPMAPLASRVTPQHHTAGDLRAMFDDGFFDYAFAIVRDPYARIESEYRMRMMLRQGPATPPFSSWLAHHVQAARNNPFALDNHLRPQSDFLDSDMRIFKLEDGLDAALARVAVDCGLADQPVGRERVTVDRFKGTIRWAGRDRILVNEFYARDFELLGYERIAAGLDLVEPQ